LDELKIYRRKLSALEVLYHYQQGDIAETLDYLDENSTTLQEYYHDHFNPSVKSISKSLYSDRTELNQKINEIPEIMVLGDLPEPRPTHVLNRGLYHAQGPSVEVGTPSAVLAFNQELPRNRLGLAQWLFESDHPLTSRVFVNRIWQMHFGKGIVATSDDFGSQGAIPSHPELLDWLAVTFMESAWDIKQLHKVIVMSSTFQQSSRLNPEMLEADPENVLLSRGPSYRMKSEMIRDNALSISGLLVDKIGGPSVYPYQPEGLWDEISNKVWRYKYLQQPGEGLYRRSLYTIWKRSSPPPSMLVFDAPGRDVCRVRRANTSTPLQALVLLNDPQYLEAARVMAEKIRSERNDQPLEQLTLAFKQAIGRHPDKQELDILSKFYQQEVERFSDDKMAVQSYLTIGEMPAVNQAEPIELAALATVVHSILNTNESYTLR
jgi:hypothetical protein